MATIIKLDSPAHPTRKTLRAVAYDLTDMSNQADSYLETVRQEAGKIVLQAKRQAAEIEQQAEQAGRKAAQDAIEKILDEKVAQQMKTLVPALDSAIAQIEDSKHEWLRHWESSVVKLATSIAGRLVRRELKQHPELTLEWIGESLQLAAGSAKVTLRLHPTDLKTLRSEVEKLIEVFCPLASAKIVADESITVGGCRVETEFGTIDQQIETQLARVEQELS